MTEQVPSHYIGVWQREIKREATAPADRTTKVYWLQTSRWHADIRIPAERPDFSGVTSLAQCSDAQLHALLQQESFCGVTVVEDDICRWVRHLDLTLWETEDIGRMQFNGDVVEESGVIIDVYELWRRLPDTAATSYTMEQVPIADGSDDVQKAFLCVVGDYFIYTRNRAMWTAAAVRARHQIRLGTTPRAALEAYLDFEGSFGKIDDGIGRITLSTLPWREGQIAFALADFRAGSAAGTSNTKGRWQTIV